MSRVFTTSLPDGTSLTIDLADDVFRPNLTTELCIKAAWSTVRPPARILDLGCGSGVVGLSVAKLFGSGIDVCASDLSPAAVELAGANARKLGVPIDVRTGSCLDPWRGDRFDFILDDVAGIAEPVAAVSPWYRDGVPCASGEDGTSLIREVLESAGACLKDSGALLFPVISLSDHRRILDAATTAFDDVDLVFERQWQLPDEMLEHLSLLHDLRHRGLIEFSERFGMRLCWTRIYRCSLTKRRGHD